MATVLKMILATAGMLAVAALVWQLLQKQEGRSRNDRDGRES